MSSGHDCKDCNERYNACKCPAYAKPPEGIMPKAIWNHIRAQNLRDAIKRYTKAGLNYPDIWMIELREVENV